MGTTKIDWDVDYFSRFVDHDPTADPGLGLFQNTDGMFDLPVIGPNIVSILKKNLHPLQKVIPWKVVMMRIMLYVPQHNQS